MSTSKQPDKQLDDTKTGEDQQTRFRALAVQHALSIEEKKKLQGKVLDMILLAFDLPSDSIDATHPTPTDIKTFKACLNLFRPSDLDELVEERNIDDRCGYALCKNSSPRQDPSKSKVWDPKTGKLVNKKDFGQYCSKQCREMNKFVRRQLSDEPAWLRQAQERDIRLLTDSMMELEHKLSSDADHSAAKLSILSQERGETDVRDSTNIEIHEKQPQNMPAPPTLENTGLVEGFPVRGISSSMKKAR